MLKFFSKLLHFCVSFVWTCVVVAVILLAVIIALGKQFTPNISDYKTQIEKILTNVIDQDVSIGSISATWVRLAPEITAQNVVIGEEFSISNLKVEPSIVESIWKQQLIMEQLSISGLALTLKQKENGFTVLGYEIQESNENAEPLTLKKIDLFLKQQHRVQINNLRLGIALTDSPFLDILVEQADLSTLKKESWLLAKAQVQAQDQQTQLELQLDSNGQGFFDAYIKHDQWDWSPWLKGVFPESLSLESMQVSGEHWLRLYGETLQTSTSLIEVQDIALKYTHTGEVSKLQNLSAQFDLDKEGVGSSDYIGTIKDLTFSQGKLNWQSSLHKFSYIDNTFQIFSNSINFGMLANLIAPFDESETLSKMKPSGKLTNSLLTVSNQEEFTFQLSARLDKINSRPANGTPGFKNLAGTLLINEQKGHLQIENDDVEIWDAGNYEYPLALDYFSADLYWQLDQEDKTLRIVSPNMKASDKLYGEAIGSVAVNLVSKEQMAKGAESTLGLWLGMNSPKFHALEELYPTKEQDIEIRSWVLNNIFEGEVNKASIIFNGPIISENPIAKKNSSFLLSTTLQNAAVKFDPTWQSVYDLSGMVTLQNKLVYADIDTGEYYDSQIFNAKAEISGLDTSFMYLTGLGKTQANNAKQFLTTSPLRTEANIGNTADLWEMNGEIDLDLQLKIPFSEDPVQAWVKSDLKDVQVIMPDEELGFNNINGQIFYDDLLGIYGEVDSIFFGEKVKSVVKTRVIKEATLTEPSVWDYDIYATGKIDIQDVARWFGEPIFQKFNGLIDYDSLLTIDADSLKLHLETDLIGADFEGVPEPIGTLNDDPISQPRPTTVDVYIPDDIDNIEVTFNYNRWLDGKLLMEGEYLTQGIITNTGPLDYRDDIGIYVDVELDYVDADFWTGYIVEAQELNETNPYNIDWPELPEGTPTVDERIKSVVLKSKTALAANILFYDMYTTMVQNDIGWVIDYKSEESEGQIGIPFSDFEPVIIGIDYLALKDKNFPESDEEEVSEEIVDLLAQSMSPKDIPITSMDVRQISYEGINYGSWQLQMQPHEKGVIIKDVRGIINGVEANGNLNWFVDENENHVTSMKMELMTPNTTQTLKAFRAPPALKAAKTEMELVLNWKGSPYLFSGSVANGTFKIGIDDGVITQLPDDVAPAIGLFKFVGLLNASKIFSRISLDFTDIMKSGQSFDSIRAEVVLNEGVATISKDRKFTMDSSSMRFSGYGDYNMLNDNLNMRGQIIVPFSSTIATVGLLSGIAAPPAAAIIFFSEKIFNKGLEKLTTWHFDIVGNINDLESLYPEVKHGGLD